MGNLKGSKNGGQKRLIIIVVFAALVVALAICITLLILRRDSGRKAKTPDGTEPAVLERGFVDQENADDIMAEMSDKVAEGMFECKMTTTWTFEDGGSVSPNAYVANVETNRYALYFDVCEEQTGEVLYASPILPVGSELQEIKLDKKLSAGDYDAVVNYTLVDEAYEEVSTVGFRITISVTK